MKTRILQFLAAENITQSEFAKRIGVSGPNVTHIISGRNKPSYDFIVNFCKHYPALNPDWLIMGTGKMYKESKEVEPHDSIFGQESTPENVPTDVEAENIELCDEINTEDNIAQSPINQRKAIRVTVFYSDGTFQDL